MPGCRAATIAVGLLLGGYAAAARSSARPRGASRLTWAGSVIDGVAVAVAATALALLAVLLLGLLRDRRRRSDEPERVYVPPPVSRWARTLALLAAVIVLSAPVAVVFATRGQHAPSGGTGQAERQTPQPTRPRSAGSTPSPVTYALLGGGTLLAAAAVAGWLRRAGGRPSDGPAAGAGQLTRSVAAGRLALRGDDPKAAIIACYAAMERTLGTAGAARRPAETPIELLDKATTSGLVRSPAATDLTHLFHEARYSAHPISETQRGAAAGALGRLSQELGGPR